MYAEENVKRLQLVATNARGQSSLSRANLSCVPVIRASHRPVPVKVIHGYDVRKECKEYATAAALLRVDKQTCSDVTTLLYQSPTRPFEVEVSAFKIDFGKIAWIVSPSLLVSPPHGARHVSTLSKCRLDRIRHLKVKVLANRSDCGQLFALLVNIRRLREALHEESMVSEEAQLSDRHTSSCLARLEIQLVYDEYNSADDAEFYPEEIFAFSRLILQFFRNLPVNFKWAIEWNVERYRRYYTHGSNKSPKKSKLTMSKTRDKITNMKVDQEKFDMDAAQFRLWTRRFNSKTINTILSKNWQQFKELQSMVFDLMNMKMLREDAGHATFMKNAHVALETRDSEALDLMKAKLREVSQEHIAAKMALLQKVQQKFLFADDAGDQSHQPEEILYDPSAYMSWPVIVSKPDRKGRPDRIIGGTLEEYTDGSKKVYRLLTPELVRERRKAKAQKTDN
ncbi:hypothetical protein FKW77_006558 [Venturia effusa]|uniref:Uncharacterized protein n=1 Tax=Venturia effusa TaxID=50376 RepID=A0A517LIY9_9PEZI|nr:hypothetical protein FKW77_006558 [Venturia effusa]